MKAREDIVVTEDSELPLSVQEFKQHSRIDYSADDALIDSYLKAATIHIRELCGRALANETREAVFERFDAVMWLPTPFARSVVSIRYLDHDYTEHTVDATAYHVANLLSPWDQAQVMPLTNWPSDVSDVVDAVRVRYVAGYGEASAVPDPLRHAIRLLAAHWYEHREDVVVGAITKAVENGVRALVEPYRFRRMF